MSTIFYNDRWYKIKLVYTLWYYTPCLFNYGVIWYVYKVMVHIHINPITYDILVQMIFYKHILLHMWDLNYKIICLIFVMIYMTHTPYKKLWYMWVQTETMWSYQMFSLILYMPYKELWYFCEWRDTVWVYGTPINLDNIYAILLIIIHINQVI